MAAFINLISRLVRLLPPERLSIAGTLLYWLIYRISGYRIKVVRENLKRAFPGKSSKELKEMEKAFYRRFSLLIPEILYIPALNKKSLQRLVKVSDSAGYRDLKSRKDRIMMLTGHFFNWEWAGLRTGLIRETPCYVVYRPLKNKTVNRLVKKWRAHLGNEPVPVKEITRKLISGKNHQPVACFLADQSTSKAQANYFCNFFGYEVPFYTGAVKLAVKLNTPLYFGYTEPVPSGYMVHIKLLSENPAQSTVAELMQVYVRTLEETIKKHPENWLWTHKRWKRAKRR